MDVTKVGAAIDNVHKELNAVIDAQVKVHNLAGFTSLDRAAKALGLVVLHLDKAVNQSTPKAIAVKKEKSKK